jgi:hypothetical protein
LEKIVWKPIVCEPIAFYQLFKGTVPRDFLPLVFFFKQLLLAPVDKPSNDFKFFRIFTKIFDYFGASPVSTTPVSDTFTVLESFTGVNDTGNACIAGVVDTVDAPVGPFAVRQCI